MMSMSIMSIPSSIKTNNIKSQHGAICAGLFFWFQLVYCISGRCHVGDDGKINKENNMIKVKYPRRGFVVEEVIEGCKTEGCSAKKLIVIPWEDYGEHDFNELTEGMTVGQNTCDDDNHGECPKCEGSVYFKRHFIVTSDANTLKTAEDAYYYAVNVLKAPFPEGEVGIATDACYSHHYAKNVLHAPFPEGEVEIATDAFYSFYYARDVLKSPFLLGEAAIATDAHMFKEYKELFPEPQEPTKISNPIRNLISEEVITETFAALKAANIEEVTVSFSDDRDGSPPLDWIKFCFNKQGIEDLIKNKKSRKDTLIRENLELDEPWHLEIYEYHFEEANIPNLKCTKELWNILVSFVYKEYETLDNKAGGYVIWRRNLVILDACENVKLRNSDPWEQIPLFASGKYVRQYDKPNYTTMKTDELDGAALDFMVSCDEYLENVIPLRDENDEIWSPSTIWEQGGVYIHLNNISICYENENQWKSYISVENTSYGSTPLVSAMRCFVKSKFGVTVDIPNWVLGKELAKA